MFHAFDFTANLYHRNETIYVSSPDTLLRGTTSLQGCRTAYTDSGEYVGVGCLSLSKYVTPDELQALPDYEVEFEDMMSQASTCPAPKSLSGIFPSHSDFHYFFTKTRKKWMRIDNMCTGLDFFYGGIDVASSIWNKKENGTFTTFSSSARKTQCLSSFMVAILAVGAVMSGWLV
eukprot:GHVS01098768.1.p1 GENE.GHVS01098768.1~~GHVS01098768.1.p1  ORF type:complete len:175 (+),score=23.06 GHVS01098768.1:99-623(+)